MSNNQEKLNEQLFNVVANDKGSDEARLKKVKYLVRLGADVNARALGIGKSILVFAKESKDEEVVKFLQDKGAIEIYPTKEEALELGRGFWIDRNNLKSLDEIKQLLKKGANVNAKNDDGKTALMWASQNGHKEVVEMLLSKGADVNEKEGNGETALMWASWSGQKEIAEILLLNKADVNVQSYGGSTALMWASYFGHKEVIELLLSNKADVNVQNKNGETALMIVSYPGYEEIKKVLEEHIKKQEENKNGEVKKSEELVNNIFKSGGR